MKSNPITPNADRALDRLTKREYAAIQALAGMFSRNKDEGTFSLPRTQSYYAKCAVEAADALLKELDK